jgi:hypothetical protein
MRLWHYSIAATDTKRPAPAARWANSLGPRFSVPRAALIVQIGRLSVRHHARRCRETASSTSERGRDEFPVTSFSPPANRSQYGLTANPSRRMRSMLRAVRVLPGNSAWAERSFFPDRFCSLWRPLQPFRRYADRERLGPP